MAELTYTPPRFVYRCSFDERIEAKVAGFTWCSIEKAWVTKNPVVAARLRRYADRETREAIERLVITIAPWTRPLPPPPTGLVPMPHQDEATLFGLGRSRSYLRLAPGLGKTIVAARIAAALKQPVVYVCPAFLRANVEEEFAKWAPGVKLILVSDSSLSRADYPWEDIFPTNAILVVDEAHRFVNLDSRRTAVLFGHKKEQGIIRQFKRQIYLSGTPMPNRPMELYPILSKVAPETIDYINQYQFGGKFCAGRRTRFGWDYTGQSNMAELARRVRHPTGPFMLRMDKRILDLPPKIEKAFIVSGSMSPKLKALDHQLEVSYRSIEDLIKKRIAAYDGRDPEDMAVASYRRLLGMEKVPLITPYIESIIEGGESLIVFAYHKTVVADLTEKLLHLKPLVISGSTPTKDRQRIAKMFQQSEKHPLLLGNYQAMGVGFNFTKATRVFFAEYDWTPAVNDQASDRPHRIGQTNTVYVQYAVYQNSLDKRILEKLFTKRHSTNYI